MRGVARIALALLGAHVALCAVRIPGVVIARRCGDIAEHRQRGAVRYHLDGEHRNGADAVEWLLANVPADGVVPYRGDSKGPIEFVPAFLAPRLLVRESACSVDGDSWSGRPLAKRYALDGARMVVLTSLADDLRIEDR